MINKVFKSIKRDGLIKTIKKIIKTIKNRLLFSNKNKNRRVIENEINITSFETVIVFENNFGWNKIMKQRPQQIASSLPKETLMIYHSHEDNDYVGKNRIRKLKDNLVLMDLGYFRDDMLEILAAHNNKYLLIYSTDFIPYERIKMYEDYGYNIVYEYVDDINENLCGKDMYKILKKRHNSIIKDNSIVICTASKLYDDLDKNVLNNSKLITNGVDYEHFEYKNYELPDDLKDIKEKYKNVLCYYGALASWFDYDLIKEVAEDKSLGIVLIGQDYDQTLEASNILEIDNIYYLGKKEYDELPKYGCNVDVFLIPFVINDITMATSPVKLFEYMAMQKPIVTTDLNECKKYESVLNSKSTKDFIENINKAINLKNDSKYKELLIKEAKENTWKSKCNELVSFINKKSYEKIQNKILDVLNTEKYDRIILWRSPFGWNVPLFQRPQHIAKQLANQKCLVFYEVTSKTDLVRTIEKKQSNLYLINLENYYVINALSDVLNKVKKPKYLQIYSTNWSMGLDELKEYQSNGFKILYEYIDDISPELAGTDELPPFIVDKYEYALKNKDVLIVTTANELYDIVKKKRGEKNLVLSSNGVDYEFFQKLDKKYKFENEFENVINNGKINICYYGALASWFDYDLIKKINETNKYNIILLGIKYDNSFDESKIIELKNVHFFGPKDYEVLKNYASKMDILTIPFKINSITKATSPLKLFEYMALHKPIVTTAMDECQKYKSVLVADSQEEFLEQLEEGTKIKTNTEYIEQLDRDAKNNDWSEKAKIIIDLLSENER